VRAVVDHVEAKVKTELGRAPVRTEGIREQQWTLIDYGDVVVHVFLDSVREFYEIERLYMDAARIGWELPVTEPE
jgi:ribosome-associated protein